MLRLLAHEYAHTEISCPSLMNVTQALIDRGVTLTDKHITSDTLRGIGVLTIGVWVGYLWTSK